MDKISLAEQTNSQEIPSSHTLLSKLIAFPEKTYWDSTKNYWIIRNI